MMRKPEEVVEEVALWVSEGVSAVASAVVSPPGLLALCATLAAVLLGRLFWERSLASKEARAAEDARLARDEAKERSKASKKNKFRIKEEVGSVTRGADEVRAEAERARQEVAAREERGREVLSKERAAAHREAAAKARALEEAAAEREREGAAAWKESWAAEQDRVRRVALEERASVWTAEQDAALVAGLKAHPLGSCKDTREWIAKAASQVPGKGAKECAARLRQLQEKKPSAPSAASRREARDAEGLFGGGGGGSEGSEGSEGGEYSESESDDDMPPRMEVELNPAHEGTQVELTGMELINVATIQPEDLHVQVSCLRCGANSDVHLSGAVKGESEYKSWCGGCRAIMTLSLRPCLAHAAEGGSTLGYVDTFACDVVDLLPSNLYVTCMECSAPQVLPPFNRGQRLHSQCYDCHTKMVLLLEGIRIHRITPAAGAAAGAAGGGRADRAAKIQNEISALEDRLKKFKGRAKEAERNLGIVEGAALPKSGACSHFRRSLKWLRFPCCGRAFPCPSCHEASDCPAAGMGVWANRQICGKCSKEQSASSKPCSACGFDMGAGASKSHWQGGAGMRDATRLAKKDSRHKDARWDKSKTVSRKAAAKAAGSGKKKKKAPPAAN